MTGGSKAAAGIGHNGGPSMAGGRSWRRHCWSAARASLLPTLPIEVVRLRVRRAAELGLDYRTYASVRAASGHDVVAFLFSSNALRVMPNRPALPQDREARLAAIRACGRLGLASAPLSAGMLQAAVPLLDGAFPAPAALGSFGQARDALRAALGTTPSDRVILIGDMAQERDWLAAGRLAFYLSAERYFG
ncbi:MAG: hypothetical protein QM656_07070 [Paracoccaceae bacterium]